MPVEILQEGDLGAESERGYSQVSDNFVVGPGVRYEFPDDYTFRTKGSSLLVLDGEGEVAMILAAGAWSAVGVAGMELAVENDEDDDE